MSDQALENEPGIAGELPGEPAPTAAEFEARNALEARANGDGRAGRAAGDADRAQGGELLPFVTLTAFVARVDEQAREPLVGRSERSFLPRGGLGVIGGVGGSAKTTYVLDAVAHWASGTLWHELEIPRPLRIGMIDVEGPREPLRQKIGHKVEVWPGSPFAHNVVILDGEQWGDFSLARTQDRHRLRHTCAELAVDLVVCNPLGRLGMPGGGTPEEVGTFVGWLRECGLWEDLAFFLIHHFNRGVHRDVLMRLSGAWDRDADTILGLAREGERRTKLTWAKFRWALDGGPAESTEILEWEVETLGFRRVETEAGGKVADDEMLDRIREAVEAQPGLNMSELRASVTGDDARIARLARAEVEAGCLVNRAARKGAYALHLPELPGEPPPPGDTGKGELW